MWWRRSRHSDGCGKGKVTFPPLFDIQIPTDNEYSRNTFWHVDCLPIDSGSTVRGICLKPRIETLVIEPHKVKTGGERGSRKEKLCKM